MGKFYLNFMLSISFHSDASGSFNVSLASYSERVVFFPVMLRHL